MVCGFLVLGFVCDGSGELNGMGRYLIIMREKNKMGLKKKNGLIFYLLILVKFISGDFHRKIIYP